MEAVAVASSSSSSYFSPLVFSSPSCSLRSRFSLSTSVTCGVPSSLCLNSNKPRLRALHLALPKEKIRTGTALRCSPSENALAGYSERWLLEPIGDGDSRHIGYRVARPGAFEIASDAVTVGRLPEKADIVLSVATVSGLHARLEKKEGGLLLTDLDSTNGTFIDDKKLRPGAATPVPPGCCITFGDSNLAIFRVSKIEVESTSKSGEAEIGSEVDAQAVNSE